MKIKEEKYDVSHQKNVVNQKDTTINNLETASALHHLNTWYVLLTTLNRNHVEVSVFLNSPCSLNLSEMNEIEENMCIYFTALKKNKKYRYIKNMI